MKRLFVHIAFLYCMVSYAQVTQPVAMITTAGGKTDHQIKRLSNSESPEVTFIIDSDLKGNTLNIKTNYKERYKVRFLGYYGGSKMVVKNLSSNAVIDIADYREKVFIMNITDEQSNKLLTTQVVNLKRKN